MLLESLCFQGISRASAVSWRQWSPYTPAKLMKYKRVGPTTGSTLPGGSDVGTLGRLEQLAVRGGIGVGLAINVFWVIVGHQVVDVLVVGRVHVWVRRWY